MEKSGYTQGLGIGGKPFYDTTCVDVKATTVLTKFYEASQNMRVRIHCTNDTTLNHWVRVVRDYAGQNPNPIIARETLKGYEHSVKPIDLNLKPGSSLYVQADANDAVWIHLEVLFEV